MHEITHHTATYYVFRGMSNYSAKSSRHRHQTVVTNFESRAFDIVKVSSD